MLFEVTTIYLQQLVQARYVAEVEEPVKRGAMRETDPVIEDFMKRLFKIVEETEYISGV